MEKVIKRKSETKLAALSLSLVLVITIVALGIAVADDMTPNNVKGRVLWNVNSTPAVGISVEVTCNMTTVTAVTNSAPPSQVGRFDTLPVPGWDQGMAFTILIPGYVIDSGNTSGTLAVSETDVGDLSISISAIADTEPPVTTVTAPAMPGEPSPLPSGHELPWTKTAVTLSFRRVDPNSTGVAYTNLSAATAIANVDVEGQTMTIPQEGTGNLTINTTAFGETFNLTISQDVNTKIYYYSVDKNETPNVEANKTVTVKIDVTDPVINSVVLDDDTPDPSGPIVVTVDATDALSGVATVTANGEPLSGSPWSGTIYAEFLPGTYNVVVNVTDNAGNTVTNATTQYTVPVVYGVDLTDPADQQTYENVNANYAITVNNTGNVQEIFNLNVTNTDIAAVAVLSTAQVTLDVGGSTVVNLTVTDETAATYNVSVSVQSVTDPTATDTVTIMTTVLPAPVVTTITVAPSTKTLNVGDTQQFTATATDQYTNPMTGIIFTWTSSDTAVGTIDANGVFTAKAEGTTTITATNGPVSGTATVTVELVYHRVGGGGGYSKDSDGDGLSDLDELLIYKTDPYKADTDEGGVNDGEEVARGTDPLDPADDFPPTATPTPATPTPATPTPATPTPATPTPATPTPTPTPPGFEAVFAIASLLAIAYVVLRKKK
jgi:hypothetical protein